MPERKGAAGRAQLISRDAAMCCSIAVLNASVDPQPSTRGIGYLLEVSSAGSVYGRTDTLNPRESSNARFRSGERCS